MEEKAIEQQEKPNKKRLVIRTSLIVLATCLLVFAAYKLIRIFSEYRKANEEYASIVGEVVENSSETASGEQVDSSKTPSLKVDFDKLKKSNKDIVGWIYFEKPESINYPIVRGEDNGKYLRTTFEGKKNSSGAIFMDALDNAEFADRNTFIYGHNMSSGSMFAGLLKYKSEDFYKKNPYFYIYTPDGKEVQYQIFAVCVVEGDTKSYTRFYNNEQEYLDYLKYEKKISLYDTGVKVDEKSKIVSLSTCTNTSNTQRFLVHGVKVGEKVIEK